MLGNILAVTAKTNHLQPNRHSRELIDTFLLCLFLRLLLVAKSSNISVTYRTVYLSGYFCLDTSSAPELCRAGQYNLDPAQTSCTSCPAGSFCASPDLPPVPCSSGILDLLLHVEEREGWVLGRVGGCVNPLVC